MPKRIELSGIVGYEITAKGLKNKLPKNGEKAILVVDSEGGSVFEANRLYNLISDHLKQYPDSLAVEYGAIGASAASYFPLAVGSKNISVRENTTFMAHKAWNFAMGNSDDMLLTAEILDGLDRMIANVYTRSTGKTIDETLLDMKNELWIFGGKNIVDSGFAGNLIEDDGEEIEPVAKSVISAKIEESKNQLRGIDNKEDLNKWVAMINPVDVIETKPPQADGNIKEGDFTNMELEEFLNKNPEAKAKNDISIKNAVDEAVKNERERGSKILNLAGASVTENVMNAFKEGLSVGDFAVNEVEAQNELRKETKPQNLGKIEVKDQLPKGEDSKAEKEKAIENSVENSVDEFLKGAK